MDICGQETGESGGVGVPTDNFRLFCKRDGLLGRGNSPTAVVEAGVSVEASEVHGRSDLDSGKGAAATGIW